MELIRLRLRGAIGIREGVGLDEIDLDLTGLRGMIALDGDNGRGKSTLLDNMHAYRFLPSRKKKALQHHFYLRDSFRDLEMIYKGRHYRFLLKIDPVAGKQEGFVYVDGAGESVVAGKATEYDRFVEGLFGSPELFLSSVFCAQKTDDSLMTVGDMKKQYAEFLKLHELQAHADTAKRCEAVLLGHIETIERSLDKIQDRAFALSDAKDRLDRKTTDEAEMVQAIEQRRAQVAEHEKKIEALTERHTANQVAIEQSKTAAAEVARLRKQILELKETHERNLSAIDVSIQAANDDIKKYQGILGDRAKIEQAEQRLQEIADELTRLDADEQTLDGTVQAIEKDITAERESADAQMKEIDQRIAAIEADLRNHRENCHTIETALHTERATVEALKNDKEKSDLLFRIEVCQDKTLDLEKRDPACASKTCSFIVGAIEAGEKLPELERQLEERNQQIIAQENEHKRKINDLVDRRFDIAAQVQTCQVSLDTERHIKETIGSKAILATRELGLKRSEVTIQRNAIRVNRLTLKDESRSLSSLVAKKAELEVAQARTIDLKAALNDAITKKSDADRAYLEKRKKLLADAAVAETRLTSIVIDESVAAELAMARRLFESDRVVCRDLEGKLSAARAEIAGLKKDVEAFDAAAKEIAELQAKSDNFHVEAQHWAYLKRALGRDGLQALEIDSVAPVISGIANSLLSSTFGPAFQVRLETLKDNGKETMEIWVLRENGTEVLLDDLSGGEKVWVLKALRLARTVISKEKSGNEFLSCFADEQDGPLRHGETTESFTELNRAFMSVANFQTFFFISHKPEALAMADQVIRFYDGGVTVE